MGGLFLLFGVNPGTVFPDIGHVKVILIESRLSKRIPEKGFKRPGRTGTDHHPVKAFFFGQICYFLGRIGGTGKNLFLGIHHIGEGQRILNRGGNIDDTGDVGSAVADKHTDSRLFV